MTPRLGTLALALLVGCAGRSGTTAPGGVDRPAHKTIVLGVTRLDPDDLTITPNDGVGFLNTATEPLQVEFIRPKEQATSIRCHLTDPEALKAGQAPWAEFRLNDEAHYTADMPPGRFPSACRLAPGFYTYVVHVVGSGTAQLRLGQEGTITVK